MQCMKYLHTMVRVTDIEASLAFYRDALGMDVLSRRDHEAGRYTLVFLTPEKSQNVPAFSGAARAATCHRHRSRRV